MNIATLNMSSLDGDVILIKGSGGSGGGSTWRYFDISKSAAIVDKSGIAEFGAMHLKMQSTNGNITFSSAAVGAITGFEECVAFGVDTSQMTNQTGDMMSYADLFNMMPGLFEQLGIIELTKEQFYSLD